VYEETDAGIRKRVTRKRPGTLGVCALLQNKFRVDAVPHVLCEGFTREETEDFLIELHYLGIDNVFAVRGDSSGYEKLLQHGRTRNLYATDLVAQITAMNTGRFLEENIDASPTNFCIGVAAYPEKHVEAPNLQADIARVKQKIDLGAEYIVTQMFFDNRRYFDLVEQCRAQGITVPIIPGLKVLTTAQQTKSLPATFNCDIPSALAGEVEKAPDHARDIGIAWAIEQGRELLAGGVPSMHFFVTSSSSAVDEVLAAIRN
jgi:methylenetetrahydrofolate reductase (NADPH)